MGQPEPVREQSGSGIPWFAATHWSVVQAAGHASPPQRAAALETLCRTYWEPLYAYLRSLGRDRHDAQDLTQAFLAHLLARNPFATLAPGKGKFRSFLLKSLQHFLADQHDRDTAARRGGGQALIPLEPGLAERYHALEDAQPCLPDLSFDRRWAVTVLNRAFAALQREFVAAHREAQFPALSVFLAAEGTRDDYAAAAGRLHMTAGAVAVAVHRLRARYRECIRGEIRQTVADPREVEGEMRYLLELLCA
jgi:RNA polymerase sigma-70 factor (ECF subfamily)